MDKRTLLFVVSLSLSLFLVSIFFQYQNAQQKKEWMEQQKAKKATKDQKLVEEIEHRTAKLQDLPLVRIYADDNQTEFLTSGLLIQDQLLALAWTEELPQKVYATSIDSQKTQAYQLLHSQNGIGAPVFYGQKNGASLLIASLPDFGRYDVQVVHFQSSNPNHLADITLGEYKDGQLSLLGNGLSSSHPYSIALFKTSEGYLPVGFYNSQDQVFVRAESMEGLNQYAKVFQEKTTPKKSFMY
jgi:YidC/Oxa1 family membrane protein insertase